MLRAGVFIGVDKTGNLQRLNDAAAGARRMYEWALTQGITKETHARLITDADGATVDPDTIYNAIKIIVDGAGVDQLIVYFAGHGVNIARNEQWLLTDAPAKASAAVNVSGSVELARYCGIGHVVIISDACRVAPEGIQAQYVRGVDIFPNNAVGEKSKPVDQFFACFLGRTASELKDPTVAAGTFSALYTDVLLDVLRGNRLEALEPSECTDDKATYIRPRGLERYLEKEIPRRVAAMKLQFQVNQNPDAIITSDQTWLARFDLRDTVSQTTLRGTATKRKETAPRNLRTITNELVRSAALGDPLGLAAKLHWAQKTHTAGVDALLNMVQYVATPFGPEHFDTRCGIKVRGAHIVDVLALRAVAHPVGSQAVRIDKLQGQSVSVLIQFSGDIGVVIPAIDGFIAGLSFEDGELIDVAYEPSANTSRGGIYKSRADELRALRALAASSLHHGRFRLDQQNAGLIACKIQDAKGIDPSFAIYAAYAYNDLQDIQRIGDMSKYLQSYIGCTFFDLSLLSRSLSGKTVGPTEGVVPFFPLLAQGWALLNAHSVKLHPALAGIERSMHDSAWTTFAGEGIDQLRNALQTLEAR